MTSWPAGWWVLKQVVIVWKLVFHGSWLIFHSCGFWCSLWLWESWSGAGRALLAMAPRSNLEPVSHPRVAEQWTLDFDKLEFRDGHDQIVGGRFGVSFGSCEWFSVSLCVRDHLSSCSMRVRTSHGWASVNADHRYQHHHPRHHHDHEIQNES